MHSGIEVFIYSRVAVYYIFAGRNALYTLPGCQQKCITEKGNISILVGDGWPYKFGAIWILNSLITN